MDIIQKWELRNELRSIELGEYIGDFSLLRAEVYRRRVLEKMASLEWPGTDWNLSSNIIVQQARIRIKDGKIKVRYEINPLNHYDKIFTYA